MLLELSYHKNGIKKFMDFFTDVEFETVVSKYQEWTIRTCWAVPIVLGLLHVWLKTIT